MLELVPPGRVIFLRPLKTQGARSGWDAVWVKAEEVIREVTCLPYVGKCRIQQLVLRYCPLVPVSRQMWCSHRPEDGRRAARLGRWLGKGRGGFQSVLLSSQVYDMQGGVLVGRLLVMGCFHGLLVSRQIGCSCVSLLS